MSQIVGVDHPAASLHTPELPTEISSPRGKLVYLYLHCYGESTLQQLEARLQMKKISLFAVCGKLEDAGVIGRRGDRYFLR
jgi:DNA-binding MarR family transcriptional regulator